MISVKFRNKNVAIKTNEDVNDKNKCKQIRRQPSCGISVKVYCKREDVLVVACDSELLGKKFTEGEMCLELSSFYDGKKVSEKIFLEHMANATSANLVGEKTINAAVNAGFIGKENIIRVQGVPYAVMVRV